MNVIVFRKCSNSCPYCFELEERTRDTKPSLDVDDARRLARWSARAGVNSIKLLGGEPFLHPRFSDILATFYQELPEASYTIFTGGIIAPHCLDFLPPAGPMLLFNVNELRDYRSPREAHLVLDLIDRAIRKGLRVALGFNVWRLDFDPQFMPRLAHSLGRTGFRWAVANPLWNSSNPRTVRPNQFPKLSLRCLEMLDCASQLGLTCDLDCHLPLCFFTIEQRGWLLTHQPSAAMHLGTCDMPIDVSPELEAFRCFSTAKVSRARILDFPTLDAVRLHLSKQVDEVLLPEPGISPECATCWAFASKRCQGGCLGWRAAPDHVTPSSLAAKIHERLLTGPPQEILSLVEQTGGHFLSPFALYLAATAAHSMGDDGTAYRYAAQALSHTADDVLRAKAIRLLNKLAPRATARGCDACKTDEKRV